MEKYKSKLIFNNYIVDQIIFKYNRNFKDKPVDIDFSILKNTKKIDNKMEVTLETTIFENAETNNYPFEMMVKLTGFFTEENNDEKIDFEPNAIAILYPYVRSIVSTYTANANVNSLTLPTINVNKLLD